MITELDLLEKNIESAIELREGALVKGSVASWEEYKHMSGIVAGLKGALDALREIREKYVDN